MSKLEKAAVAIGITVQGCSPAQESFLSVQTCVTDSQGVAELKDVMRAVAQAEGLQFLDNSAQQAKSLKSLGADKALGRDVSRAIDVHIEGRNGLGVTAGNLGLPAYQVAWVSRKALIQPKRIGFQIGLSKHCRSAGT